jgi:hypothetical protein
VTSKNAYPDELIHMRTEAEQLLAAYVRDVSSEDERAHWARLQSELAHHWAWRDVAFSDRALTSAGST